MTKCPFRNAYNLYFFVRVHYMKRIALRRIMYVLHQKNSLDFIWKFQLYYLSLPTNSILKTNNSTKVAQKLVHNSKT
jgi:hypothetical protein